MAPTHQPNRRPFPRGSVCHELGGHPDLHLRQRAGMEEYFRERNPTGYQHDLGAQDIFLDNMGVLVAEQFEGSAEVEERYLSVVQHQLDRWELLPLQVEQRRPWWGKNLNPMSRRAQAGEPRGLLRFLGEVATQFGPFEAAALFGDSADTEGARVHWQSWDQERGWTDPWASFHGESVAPGGHGRAPRRRYADWRADASNRLFGRGRSSLTSPESLEPRRYSLGVPLPDHLARPVSELRLLPPRHASPDLPMRVGVGRMDRKFYRTVLEGRDQGLLETCTSFAAVMSLEVALRRARVEVRNARFSPAWAHLASGAGLEGGRSLSDVVDTIRTGGLPCSDSKLPYRDLESGKVRRFGDIPIAAHRDAERLSAEAGRPQFRLLDHADIPVLKAHLAAGWTLMVSVRITESFQMCGTDELGLPLLPLPGDVPRGGHAFCIVGYDHVDGAGQWKYQGRFLALNSWGPVYGCRSIYGPGTLSLPFAFLLSEGIEAWAVRF